MNQTVQQELSGRTRGKGCSRPQRNSAIAAKAAHSRGLGAKAPFSRRSLQRENTDHLGTGGVSAENGQLGFAPAFFDHQTSTTYRSRFADGQLAPCHILDGLPEELVVERSASGRVIAVRASVMSGFLLQGQFYTRDEAARKIAEFA